MRKKIGFVLFLSLSLPSPLAACLCEIVDRAPAELVPTYSEEGIASRGVVFVGEVLGLRNPSHSSDLKRWPQRPQEVLFLVKRAWKGIDQDTVTLEVGRDAPCALYARYRTYLVVANWEEGVLRAPPCDVSLEVDNTVAKEAISRLGTVRYTAPSMGSRSIDRDMIGVGQAAPSNPDSVWAAFAVQNEVPAEVLIADRSFRPRGRSVAFKMPPGFYRAVLVWPDGFRTFHDLLLRCEEVGQDAKHCSTFLFDLGLPR